jgi:hypothetical protein
LIMYIEMKMTYRDQREASIKTGYEPSVHGKHDPLGYRTVRAGKSLNIKARLHDNAPYFLYPVRNRESITTRVTAMRIEPTAPRMLIAMERPCQRGINFKVSLLAYSSLTFSFFNCWNV